MLHENLKLFRLAEGLSQEEMAAKLGYDSINGYAKVERGEAVPKVSKLKQMADILNIDLPALIGSREINNTVNIKGDYYGSQNVILLSETQCAHELEKAQLLLQERDKENQQLKEQINLLKEVIALMKTTSPQT
jgi:transcriptional regulator with XRE-family HTH domain